MMAREKWRLVRLKKYEEAKRESWHPKLGTNGSGCRTAHGS